jgi:hypothetical protein
MITRRKGKLRSFIVTRLEARRWIKIRASGLRWLKRMIARGERREGKADVL